jgi:hypothetical protein
MCAVFGAAVMLLWNALMPQIFALQRINYLQATGLLLLARIFFGRMGVGGWERAGDQRHIQQGNKLREKWMNMSDDERKEFIKKERDFFKFNRGFHMHEFFGDEKGPGLNTEANEKKEQGDKNDK